MLEPLTIDLTCVPATQNPKRPMTVCTTAMAVVTAATDGGLLSPLSECAISGPSAQNGINHKIMSATPNRRRNGDKPADSASLVLGAPWRMLIPYSVLRAAPDSCCRVTEPRVATSIGPLVAETCIFQASVLENRTIRAVPGWACRIDALGVARWRRLKRPNSCSQEAYW